MKKTKTREALCSDFLYQKMQTESAFTSFPQRWMLDNTSGFCLQLFRCNILRIFNFDHIYFLAKDVLFLPLHWLAVSTLTLCTNWSIVLHWMYYSSGRGARAHDPPLSLALYFRFVQAVQNARTWFHQQVHKPLHPPSRLQNPNN